MVGITLLLLVILLTGTWPVYAEIPVPGLVANLCISGNTDVFEVGSTQSIDSPTDCIEKCFMEGSTHMGLNDNACYCGKLKLILSPDTSYDPDNCMPCPSSTEYTCGRAADDSLYVYLLQECPVGKFGIYCEHHCYCAAQAGGSPNPCTVTGTCQGNCARGYMGPTCSEIDGAQDAAPRTFPAFSLSGTSTSVKVDASMNPPLSMMDSRTWIPAVAGVVGSFAIVTIVLVGVLCCWYIRRGNNNSTKRDQPQNVLSDSHQRKTMANLPEVSLNEYEEIGEPYYLEPHQKGIAGPADGPSTNHQHEMLQKFDDWVKRNNISQTTWVKLHRQTILTIDDLKKLKKKDILELNLTIGDRNNLKAALKTLKK